MTDKLRAIAKAAPERIWLLDWPDASATWCADPDPDGEHFDSVEYVRADRLTALTERVNAFTACRKPAKTVNSIHGQVEVGESWSITELNKALAAALAGSTER